MKQAKNKIVTSIVLSSVASMSLMGAVYVVPSDIDNYKAKTDQSFYDMYQNNDSVIANGVDDELKNKLSNIDTSGRVATGSTINRVGQASVAGSPIKGGTVGGFRLNGRKYDVTIDKKGNTTLSGYGADGKSRIIITGKQAVNPRGLRCKVEGKFGCNVFERTADEIYFDLPTGTLSTNTVQQASSATYATYNGKYVSRPTGNWHTINIVKIDKKKLDILDILNNKETTTRTYTLVGNEYSGSNSNSNSNGKYNSTLRTFK